MSTAEIQTPVRSSSVTSTDTGRNPIIVRRELRNYASQIFDYTLKLLDATANPNAGSTTLSQDRQQRRREGSGGSSRNNADEAGEGRRGSGESGESERRLNRGYDVNGPVGI